MEFAALDFETTGLDLRRDAIVSFGVVPVRLGRIDLHGALYREISPDAALTHQSIAIHHLRPVDLAGAPALTEVTESLREVLDRRFLLAWSAEIEATFLARTFGGRARRWLARTIDVLRMAVMADRIEGGYGPERSHLLADAVARAGLPAEEAHDALNDALMTAEMFLVLCNRLRVHGFGDVRSLIRAARPRAGGGRRT